MFLGFSSCRHGASKDGEVIVASEAPRVSHDEDKAPEPTQATDGKGVEKAVERASSPTPRCVVAWDDTPKAPAPSPENCPQPDTALTELPLGTLTFEDAPNAPSLRVERAENDADRQRGLMFRTSMDDDAGMLFSWTEERPRSFWMKNTCLPLDMLFIDEDGFIVGILEQVPTLNLAPRGVRCPATRVLEVNAGFCRRFGVEPGQRVTVDF